jgi:hypothetical protein
MADDDTVIRQLQATIQHVLHCYSIIENELTGVKEMPVTMKDLEFRHAHLLAKARQYVDNDYERQLLAKYDEICHRLIRDALYVRRKRDWDINIDEYITDAIERALKERSDG